MSRESIPLSVPDISQFARALARQLNEAGEVPSHLSLMNMLARAGGFQNFQHLKASHAARDRLAESEAQEAVDFRLVERTLKQFDARGRMLQWPSRQPVAELCLWALWASFPAGEELKEREVNDLLAWLHSFEDPALLRRALFDHGLIDRNRDGTGYLRKEQRPPAEAREVVRVLKERRVASE